MNQTRRNKLKASRAAQQQLLATARELTASLSSQYLIATISAHYRSNQVSLKDAAKACMMTEDNFLRAQTVIDDEARRMIAETEKFYKPHPFDYEFFLKNPGCIVVRRDGKPAKFVRTMEEERPVDPLVFISEKENGEDCEFCYDHKGHLAGIDADHPFDLFIRGL